MRGKGKKSAASRHSSGRGYMVQLLMNVGVSTVIAIIIETFLVSNLSAFSSFLYQTGSESPWIMGFSFGSTVSVLLFVLFGIIVFTVTFLILQRKTARDIEIIAQAVARISEGDLTTELDIEGEGELAHIAESINRMEHDITELLERERETEKSKTDLITNVAHDLRTPLTSILGYLDVVKRNLTEEVPDADLKAKYREQAKFVELVLKQANRLKKLIEDLFGFTKLSYGQMNMNISQLDIVKLLTQLLEDYYPSFEKSHLSYEFMSNTKSQIIEADGDLLARLFENLISNAIKYGADGKRVNVSLRAEKEMVVARVVNYGFVIPEKELPLVFDKFYRVEQSRSTSTGGTGLGLAIVKDIAELHHGSVVASSDLSGTCFTVRLPLFYVEETREF